MCALTNSILTNTIPRSKAIVRGNIIYHVSASVSVQSTSRDTVCRDNAWTYGRCTARIVQPRWKKARYDILKWIIFCSVLFCSFLTFLLC